MQIYTVSPGEKVHKRHNMCINMNRCSEPFRKYEQLEVQRQIKCLCDESWKRNEVEVKMLNSNLISDICITNRPVVAAKHNDATPGDAKGEEDLACSFPPHLGSI